MEAIENKSLFSQVWWAKYFGLYSCQNNVNGFSGKMYFGTNDIHLDQRLLRDKESCAIEIRGNKLWLQNGIFTKNGDFSLQSLLVMINRLKNKDFDIEKEVVECHSFARLVLIEFIHDMLEIFEPKVFEWNYDYQDKGLNQDYAYWKNLFLASRNDAFDIKNVWKLYARKQEE